MNLEACYEISIPITKSMTLDVRSHQSSKVIQNEIDHTFSLRITNEPEST